MVVRLRFFVQLSFFLWRLRGRPVKVFCLAQLFFCAGSMVVRLKLFVQLSFFSDFYQSSVCAVRGALVSLITPSF